MPPFLRSILAVIAGFIAMNFVVTIATVIAMKTMHLKSGHPTPGYLALNLVYNVLAATVAGLVTALIAGRKPIVHAGVVAAIILVFGAFSFWHYAGPMPLWDQWFTILGCPAFVLVGGYIVERKERSLIA